MGDSTRTRALHYAAKLVGGGPAIAKRLGVLPATIEAWMQASPEIPESEFLLAVDILLEHNGRPRD